MDLKKAKTSTKRDAAWWGAGWSAGLMLVLLPYIALHLFNHIKCSDDIWTVTAIRETGNWLVFPVLYYYDVCGWVFALLTQYAVFNFLNPEKYYGWISIAYMILGGICMGWGVRRLTAQTGKACPWLTAFTVPLLLVVSYATHLEESFYHVSSSIWVVASCLMVPFFAWLCFPPVCQSSMQRMSYALSVAILAIFLGAFGLTPSLMVNAFLLVGCIEAFLSRRDHRRVWLMAVILAIFAGCFCVLAPGNFSRANVSGAGIYFILKKILLFSKEFAAGLGASCHAGVFIAGGLYLPFAYALAKRWKNSSRRALQAAAGIGIAWLGVFCVSLFLAMQAYIPLTSKSYALSVFQIGFLIAGTAILPLAIAGVPSFEKFTRRLLGLRYFIPCCAVLFLIAMGLQVVENEKQTDGVPLYKWSTFIRQTDGYIHSLHNDGITQVVLPPYPSEPVPAFLRSSALLPVSEAPQMFSSYWSDYYGAESFRISEGPQAFLESYLESFSPLAQKRIVDCPAIHMVRREKPQSIPPDGVVNFSPARVNPGKRLYCVLEVSERTHLNACLMARPVGAGIAREATVRPRTRFLLFSPPIASVLYPMWDADFWRRQRGLSSLKKMVGPQKFAVLLNPSDGGSTVSVAIANYHAGQTLLLSDVVFYEVDADLTFDRFRNCKKLSA